MKSTCMTDGCDSERYGRGLCLACYAAARRMVGEGQTTWDDLEKLGLSAGPRSGKRSRFYLGFKKRTAKPQKEGES